MLGISLIQRVANPTYICVHLLCFDMFPQVAEFLYHQFEHNAISYIFSIQLVHKHHHHCIFMITAASK